jgi:hypothetical protein
MAHGVPITVMPQTAASIHLSSVKLPYRVLADFARVICFRLAMASKCEGDIGANRDKCMGNTGSTGPARGHRNGLSPTLNKKESPQRPFWAGSSEASARRQHIIVAMESAFGGIKALSIGRLDASLSGRCDSRHKISFFK